MRKIENLEAEYDDMLEECISLDKIFDGRKAKVLEEMDPIAYRVGFADFSADGDKWECPECAEWFDLEGDSEPEKCEECEEADPDLE